VAVKLKLNKEVERIEESGEEEVEQPASNMDLKGKKK